MQGCFRPLNWLTQDRVVPTTTLWFVLALVVSPSVTPPLFSSWSPALVVFLVKCLSTSYSLQALDGWKPPPPSWLDASEDGDVDEHEHEHLYTACEGLGGVMMEWSVAFLDRLFEVLRHKGMTFDRSI